jgi:pSer/pThr/pTyr-binding forkhead associated (FHA) protein
MRPGQSSTEPLLLALDGTPQQLELLVGRARSCDVVLEDRSVSRCHARLVFRDPTWVICDLDSTNGTLVNGVRVGRCQLRPGDRVLIGDQAVEID